MNPPKMFDDTEHERRLQAVCDRIAATQAGIATPYNSSRDDATPAPAATQRDCKHGQLARSCYICELESELATYKNAERELPPRPDYPEFCNDVAGGEWVPKVKYDDIRAAAVALKADLKFEEEEAEHFQKLFERTEGDLAAVKIQLNSYRAGIETSFWRDRAEKAEAALAEQVERRVCAEDIARQSTEKLAAVRANTIEECADLCKNYEYPEGCEQAIRALAAKERK